MTKKKAKSEWEIQRQIEKFAMEQIERYIRLHKEHEKDLDYIG